jgi:hypothetical protein
VTINGGASVFLAGRIYAVESDITFTGNANEVVNLDLNIIGNTITFAGQNQFNLTWTDTFAPVARSVALIE